jgi:hypothetical protein
MKTYGGVDVHIHIFLTSALVGGEWSASRPCRFTPGKSPRYPLVNYNIENYETSKCMGGEKLIFSTV